MEFVTKGIVLAEHTLVDAQRMLFLYTEQRGVVTAFVKSARGNKNRFYAGLQLFNYSEFTLLEKSNMTYIIKDVEVVVSFFAISSDVEKFALATYCADIVRSLSPTAEDAKMHLPFFLNTLHLICKGERDFKLLKLIFELRTMSLNGYMPDLVACAECAEYKEEQHYFDKNDGYIVCYDCAALIGKSTNISAGGVALLRHIVFSDEKSVFNCKFTSTHDGIFRLVENFALWNIDRYPSSLDAFNKLMLDKYSQLT